MAHDAHAATTEDALDGTTPHAHPALPPVHDEAPDTPMWLPLGGLALLVVFVLFAMWRTATGGDAADVVGADEVAGTAPAEGDAPAAAQAGEGAPPAAPAPAH
jgi:hypothetical protein